jgi:hypothetical protein
MQWVQGSESMSKSSAIYSAILLCKRRPELMFRFAKLESIRRSRLACTQKLNAYLIYYSRTLAGTKVATLSEGILPSEEQKLRRLEPVIAWVDSSSALVACELRFQSAKVKNYIGKCIFVSIDI